MTITNHYFYAL